MSFIAHSDCQAAITVIRVYSRGTKSIYGAMRPLPGGLPAGRSSFAHALDRHVLGCADPDTQFRQIIICMSPLSGDLLSECNVFSLAVASLLNSDSLLTLIIIKAVNNYTNRGHRTAQLELPEGCRLCVAERCGRGCCLYFTACQLRRCSCRCRNQRAQRSATQTQSQTLLESPEKAASGRKLLHAGQDTC